MKKFDYRGRLIFTTAAGEKVSALLDAAAAAAITQKINISLKGRIF